MPAIRANGRKPFQPAWPPLSSLVRVLVWVLLLCVCASVRACVCASASARLFSVCVAASMPPSGARWSYWWRGAALTRFNPPLVCMVAGWALLSPVWSSWGPGVGGVLICVRACVRALPFSACLLCWRVAPSCRAQEMSCDSLEKSREAFTKPFHSQCRRSSQYPGLHKLPWQSCAGFRGVVSENCRTPFRMIPGIA